MDVVFVLVVVYTLVQAPTLPSLGRLLGVVEPGGPADLEVETAPLEELGADLLQLRIGPRSRLAGVRLSELRLPAGAQVTLVVRGGRSIDSGPDTLLRPDDSLLVVATSDVRQRTEDRLRAVARGGKLARWYEHTQAGPQD